MCSSQKGPRSASVRCESKDRGKARAYIDPDGVDPVLHEPFPIGLAHPGVKMVFDGRGSGRKYCLAQGRDVVIISSINGTRNI